ncbi:MAG: biotin--[acetyl-CoA-carboxylase] ligase [Anaerolineae bacterium]|nr:biotin--[acetyl-CoA-carboxylase] ligase [Anaerolineae bacterium]
MNDSFTVDSLRAALGERPFRFVVSTTSTQDIARGWLQDDPALRSGAVVITEHQTTGRGRQGREWQSPPGAGILCSLILRPHIAPDQLPRMTMIGGLAVTEALDPLLPGAAVLKWPNDVLVRGRKICGILSEIAWIGDQPGPVILGIGLNVRMNFDGTDLADYATSLEPELGRSIDRHTLLPDLLRRMDHWTGRAQEPALLEAWRDRLGTLGKRVTVYVNPQRYDGESFTGVAETVDDLGALLVRLESGEVRRVIAADVGLAETGDGEQG